MTVNAIPDAVRVGTPIYYRNPGQLRPGSSGSGSDGSSGGSPALGALVLIPAAIGACVFWFFCFKKRGGEEKAGGSADAKLVVVVSPTAESSKAVFGNFSFRGKAAGPSSKLAFDPVVTAQPSASAFEQVNPMTNKGGPTLHTAAAAVAESAVDPTSPTSVSGAAA